MLQLSYTITPDDFRQYQHQYVRKRMQRSLWRGMLRAFAHPSVILLLFVLLMAVSFQVERGRSDTLLFLFGGLIGGVLLSVSLLAKTSADVQLVRPNGPFTGLVQLTVNDRGVSIMLPLLRQEYDWAAVESVSNADGSIILWLEPSIGEHIPARAFPSSEQRAAFIEFVSARIPSGETRAP